MVLTESTPNFEAEEREIIQKCQRGEKDPFARLVDRYKERVFGHLYRWIGNKEVAQEMAQDVFITAYREIKNFRGESRFYTWLFKITLNRCRDFWRSKERHFTKTLPLENQRKAVALSPDGEDALIRAEKIEKIRQAMASLPEHYRETLSLKFFSEMSCEEISAASGQSLSSVKMRVLRGLDLLRTKLKKGTL